MSTPFPSLSPTSRTWTVGSQPVASFTSMSGRETRVLLGDEQVGASLNLEFGTVPEASALAVADHFAAMRGGFYTFTLPASVFAGMTDSSTVRPAGTSWRYAGSPTIEWLMPGWASVSVSLVAVVD